MISVLLSTVLLERVVEQDLRVTDFFQQDQPQQIVTQVLQDAIDSALDNIAAALLEMHEKQEIPLGEIPEETVQQTVEDILKHFLESQ